MIVSGRGWLQWRHAAHGKAEIEKLMSDEQGGVFKASTAKMVELTVTRELGSNMAIIMAKHGSSWVAQDGRPYAFIPAPGN